MLFSQLLPYLIPGLIYGIGAVGLSLSLRFLRNPDFTSLGSIMIGGIVAARVWDNTGTILAVLAGAGAGALLGLITGFLTCRLRINLILAGIICFTAAQTPGYLVAKGSVVSLDVTDPRLPFGATFSLGDFFLVFGMGCGLCFVLAMLIRTRMGCLVTAMIADPAFLNARHRYRDIVTYGVLAVSNGIIAFAGALYAMKDRQAAIDGHKDFLPFALGAYFGGEAFIHLIGSKLDVKTTEVPTPALPVSDSSSAQNHSKLLRGLQGIFSVQRDETGRIGYIFFAYIVGCLFITTISGAARSNVLAAYLPGVNVPEHFEHLVAAILICLFVKLGYDKQS